MKLSKICERIGRQPLHIMRNREAIVFIEEKEYTITGIRYEGGRFIGFEAIGSSEFRRKKIEMLDARRKKRHSIERR